MGWAGAGGCCAQSSGPKRWVLMVGLNHSSPLPTRQHMLDYLWQKNLRQFIYKVGRTRPGRPLPTPLLGSPRSQLWTGCPSEHHPQCSAAGRRDGSPPVRTAGPDAGAPGATHADTTGPLQSGRCLERAEGWGWPEFAFEYSILPPLQQPPQEQREQLQALRQAAFEPEGESMGAGLSTDRRRSLCAREFRKLGFSVSDPYPGPFPLPPPRAAATAPEGWDVPQLPFPCPPEQQPCPGLGARAPWSAGPGQHALLL